MNSSRCCTSSALCIQAVNGTNELKYAVCGGSLLHLMFLFYAFADADGIDAKPKFICKTFNVAEGQAFFLGQSGDYIADGVQCPEASRFTS